MHQVSVPSKKCLISIFKNIFRKHWVKYDFILNSAILRTSNLNSITFIFGSFQFSVITVCNNCQTPANSSAVYFTVYSSISRVNSK